MTEEKDLTDLAREAIGNNITSGREKLKTDELIATYPDGVHINGFDIVENNGDQFPVFTFSEDENKWFAGGKALRSIADKWLEFFDGDIDAINAQLRRKSVHVVLVKTQTKKGKNYTAVRIIKEREVADNVSGE